MVDTKTDVPGSPLLYVLFHECSGIKAQTDNVFSSAAWTCHLELEEKGGELLLSLVEAKGTWKRKEGSRSGHRLS